MPLQSLRTADKRLAHQAVTLAVQPLFAPMQPIRQRVFVMHAGRRHHRAAGQPALAYSSGDTLECFTQRKAATGEQHAEVQDGDNVGDMAQQDAKAVPLDEADGQAQ